MSLGNAKQLKLQRLAIVAMGSYWAWIQSLFFNAAFSSNLADATTVFLCNVGAHFVGLALLAIGAKRFAPYIEHRVLVAASTALVCIASVAVHIGAHAALPLVELSGSLFAGVGSAVFLVVWGEAYSHIPEPTARKTTISIAVVAAFALFVVIANLPEALQVFVVAIAPIVCTSSATAAHRLAQNTSKQNDDLHRGKNIDSQKALPGWTRLLACTFLFSIPMAYFKTGTTAGSTTASFAVVLVLLAAIFLIDYLVRTKRSQTVLPHVFVLSISGGLLLLPFLTQENAFATGVLITAGSFSFRAYLYPLCLQAAEKSSYSVARTCAIATCALDGGQITGALLRNTIAALPESWFTNIAIAIAYMLFLAGFLFFTQRFENTSIEGFTTKSAIIDASNEKSPTKRQTPCITTQNVDNEKIGDQPYHTPDISHVVSGIEYQCQLTANAFSLTPREQEITALLVRGRSIQSIAEEMTLSQNTVKTHVSHIYQKCETHSREELIRLIESLQEEI